ncbi:AlpA family phage regulatory protein [Pseudomonas aeruginosa]|nr:AlpA family phage regulatory protein [Pseudomonas aeruginosa]MDI4074111.1 AlpA family phage regulatory protein [Pseudomonas aeruginosa]
MFGKNIFFCCYVILLFRDFPKPVPLVGRCVGWVDSEVHNWILARIEERDLAESAATRSTAT